MKKTLSEQIDERKRKIAARDSSSDPLKQEGNSDTKAGEPGDPTFTVLGEHGSQKAPQGDLSETIKAGEVRRQPTISTGKKGR